MHATGTVRHISPHHVTGPKTANTPLVRMH
jgi:hypothetical protein